LEIAQSTPTAASIAALTVSRYGFGKAIGSELLRRSFNQVYKLNFEGGKIVVARLSSDRPRGAPNVRFEALALEHLAGAGCLVARCLTTVDGKYSIDVSLPEGTRTLMLFEYLKGEFISDEVEDIQSFAQGLANLHLCGDSYDGPASAYTLDLDHLLLRPLEGLLRAPTMTPELRPQFELLGKKLHRDISELGTLTRVLCHGDAHGGNNFIVKNDQGQRHAVFFDFDDAGPGYLAYELAVFPWNLHPRSADTTLSDKAQGKWKHFISAYREIKPIPEVDLVAIARFMAVRQFWLLGEYAGRVPVWGSQAMPTEYLRHQVTMLQQWDTLILPL
jgi:Ser/Thr protein kinase RdoA (MazF antagonist)